MEAGLSDREAPTLLLLHGAAGAWHNWFLQVRAFAPNHRILIPDLRGHGLSPWPGPSRVEEFVDDIEILIDQEIPRSFSLFGHSFGGGLASYLMPRRGSQIERVAFLNTGGHIPRSLPYRIMMLFAPYAGSWRQFQPYAVSCTPEVIQQLLHKTLPGWNSWDMFRSVKCPALVVLGVLDGLIPVTFAMRLRSAMPNARMRIFPRGGHTSLWEEPAEINRELTQLLERRA